MTTIEKRSGETPQELKKLHQEGKMKLKKKLKKRKKRKKLKLQLTTQPGLRNWVAG